MRAVTAKPVVSVVIPCFNAEKWLAQAVESVLTQSIGEVEVVVVNDGSTDRSREIAEQYGDRIKLIDQTNHGVSAARREGVRQAKGQFIKFLDADDLLPHDSIEQLLAVARKFPGEAVLGRAVAVDEVGKVVDEGMYALPIRSEHEQWVRSEYLLTQPTSSGLWLLPRDLIDRNEFFDPEINFAEEFVFCSALVLHKVPVRSCCAIVYHARIHQSPTRLSRSRREADHLRQADLMRRAAALIRQEIPDHDPFAMTYLARLSWSRGRDSLRLGLRQVAEQYFQLARNLEPGISPIGSTLYRCVCRLAGPYTAEQLLSTLKRLLGHQQHP